MVSAANGTPREAHEMKTGTRGRPLILVADDVEETRDLIEQLLNADGYVVDTARGEREAMERAARQRPDLILVSLGSHALDPIASARRVRHGAHLGTDVPVVFFCSPTVEEGAEVAIGGNVHLTRPDNFDQLRAFIDRLLHPATLGYSPVQK
jgi:CheY-like chemotaxis protein